MKNSTIFKLLSISLLMCPLFSSAMEKELPTIKKRASDFEVYQLLSCITKNNPELNLPADIVNTIANSSYEISKEINISITKLLNQLINIKKELIKRSNLCSLNATERAQLVELIEKYNNNIKEVIEPIVERCQTNPNLTPEIHALLKEHNELEEKYKEIQDDAINQMKEINAIYGNLTTLIAEQDDIVDTLALQIESAPERVYQEPPKKNSNLTASVDNQENSTDTECRCSIQ